ncbi:unnamed protein product [Meganyctiphanes norvegica]|uniref:C-type lectin domain-containing protein n=1 Tax=Meganyctiphanes norvegica TaxID=48144 RepID=A0AAV2S9K9_MEGNR
MNWAPNEPSGIGENCIEMYDTGKWNDLNCETKRPYVCKMPASEHPVGPIEITTPNSTPESEACGWDWIENPVSGECYRIETEKLTWWDAISYCHSLHDYDYHGHDHDIVSLTTAQEQDFVYSLLQDANMNQPSIWTGLQADYDGMHWSDNTPLHYFNYNDGEPNSQGTEPCTELYMDSGKWNDQDCDKRTAFVCEKKGENYVEPVAPPPPEINCPKGWNFFNDYCYYQDIDDTKNWEDAHSVCKEQYGGELTSITSQEENQFIFGFIQYNLRSSWIGLHDDNNGSNWHWTDGNNYDDYQNWMPGEPNNSEGTEHCGQEK